MRRSNVSSPQGGAPGPLYKMMKTALMSLFYCKFDYMTIFIYILYSTVFKSKFSWAKVGKCVGKGSGSFKQM